MTLFLENLLGAKVALLSSRPDAALPGVSKPGGGRRPLTVDAPALETRTPVS